jgi:sulfonate transport system substrate-binding protein
MTSFSFSRRDLMVGGLSIAGLSMAGLTACSPQNDRKAARLSDLTLRVATYRGNPEAFFQRPASGRRPTSWRAVSSPAAT